MLSDGVSFRCANVWSGMGNTNPDLACNPMCALSGYDEGVAMDGDYSFSDPAGR